ncbi:Hypothetical protein MexAM1_META1p1101 [Methylorubrum extorquens AM1]|uniref:Uncharacterized protein n=1 Tax=Methylorubrum extorquens (strain ATCC 14718 / DSM 1338 / JCM 2805 / NCIMB 9133 / AM1) TaxID=272630 RepID=C5AXS7_METEA|nr:Hypothetical protein MexAM1_META1p1101 [Methylorubrum extorquens AM1]
MVIAELMIPSAQFASPKIPSMPEPTPWGAFHEQRIYNRRRDIHAVYGGQQQGGHLHAQPARRHHRVHRFERRAAWLRGRLVA